MNTFKLPNLLSAPDSRVSYLIDGVQYMFRFRWCHSFCLLDIYLIEDNAEIFLVKGRPLTINSDLISRVNDPDLITGSLYLTQIYGDNVEPSQENFHKDYCLVYIPENE